MAIRNETARELLMVRDALDALKGASVPTEPPKESALGELAVRPHPSLEIVPMTLRAARTYVNEVHRHHKAPQGGLFAIGAALDGKVVACVIIGRPVARMNDDGTTAEVTRLASDGSRNACSLLYAAAWRTARGMGYRRLITYTLVTEPGTSLRAAGWKLIGEAGGGKWSRPSRPREDDHPTELKLRWEAV